MKPTAPLHSAAMIALIALVFVVALGVMNRTAAMMGMDDETAVRDVLMKNALSFEKTTW